MKNIGILYPSKDPISPGNWSGTPRGLYDGLRSLGLSVVPIPCTVPLWRRVPAAVRSRLPSLGCMAYDLFLDRVRARTRSIARAIHKAGDLDGIIAMGTDLYDLELATQGSAVPLATYDDGTFTLFLRYPDSDISCSNLPETEVRTRVRLQKVACRRANIACVSTQWAKRSVVEDFGLPDERVRVVGMGHKPRSDFAFERNFETPRFLFVGVDWKRKNGAAVLDAFGKVHAEFPNAKLAVVGKHPPLEQRGVKGYGFLARENLEDQKLLDHLFATATAFVLPSLFDPSPIAYLEAASCGLPVIATICGGAGELLGDAAISVDPYDRDALFHAMLRLTDGKTAKSMGAKALSRSASSRWQDVSQRIVDGLISATSHWETRRAAPMESTI